MRSRSRPASASSSAGIVVAPAAVWTTDGGEPEQLVERAARGVDVLDAQHRHERARDPDRAVAEVDLLVAHLVAPAAPAQLGHRARRRSRTRRPAAAPTARRPVLGAQEAAPRRSPGRGDQPLGAPQPARAGREAAGGLGRHALSSVARDASRLRHRRLGLRRRAADRAARARRLDRARARALGPRRRRRAHARRRARPRRSRRPDRARGGDGGRRRLLPRRRQGRGLRALEGVRGGQRRGHPQRAARLPRRRGRRAWCT